ncbi:hypothetical protein HHI36_018259 [Cryptolaemus montrouzieri]|uniref:Uncharacterized protein n=1 Tax=Cryptolaemus montrouzieri TaxID=559131 RepID=A0ABD2NZV2_9CUCU
MSSISGLYSPLPQSISDSDSERELHMDSLCSSNHQSNGDQDMKSKMYRLNGPYSKHLQELPQAKMIKPKMSSIRKMVFVFSIIICFLPIVVFLWILPCEIDTCPVKISNWETQQEGVEMKGMINLFFERFKKHFNLAVQYKGDLNSQEILKHGVISFQGNNGGVNWYFRQSVIPERLDCSRIDVDLDGIPDCLLLDERGLKAVEVVSGQTIWHVHSHEEKTIIDNLQFPIVLKDLNGDGVDELLSVYQRKYIMIICGRTGKALSSIMVEQCNEVENLQHLNEYITFHCTNETDLYFKVKLSEITEKYADASVILNFEKYDYKYSDIDSYNLDGYKLDIGNYEKCPDCKSILKLFNSKNKLVYSRSYNKTYIAKPSKFKFGSTKFKSMMLKGHTEGYIVKLWEWYERFNPKRSTDYPFNFKRDNLNNTNFGNIITERVILITFNDTNYNVIEASSTNITQLCFFIENHVSNCQPDVKNQEDSILIFDLDRDGSQELISYSSSFYFRENSKFATNPWQLISTIKLLKLESELPKLYDTRQSFGLFPEY